jgi:hypothetical protein
MTGRLHLRLDKYLMNDPVDQAAVASIRALPPIGTKGQVKSVGDIVIPSGAAPPATVILEPGRYLVEATLPTGDLVSDEVEVVDNKDSMLELRPDESPHEWLSWQQFMGNVERIERYTSTEGPLVSFEPNVFWVADSAPPLRGDGPFGGDAWTLLAGLSGHPAETAERLSVLVPPERLNPFQSDPWAKLYQATGNGAWREWGLPTSPGGSPMPRRYLIVDAEGATHLVCVPVPWDSQSRGSRVEIPVQVLVRKRTAAEPPAITMTIRDPLVGSALAYMTEGALPTAERLFGQARDMLFWKRLNPIAAAGGGYVLLGTELGSEPKIWHSWIRNLMTWFDWLPDGAIQHGWLKLRHRESSDDLDEARHALFTAYRRGLPFYSVGLQWLIDGLTLFASQDPDAAEMLRNVSRVAWRTNSREPFTIVRLPLP